MKLVALGYLARHNRIGTYLTLTLLAGAWLSLTWLKVASLTGRSALAQALTIVPLLLELGLGLGLLAGSLWRAFRAPTIIASAVYSAGLFLFSVYVSVIGSGNSASCSCLGDTDISAPERQLLAAGLLCLSTIAYRYRS